MMTNSNNTASLVVTVRPHRDACAFARFTWSADMLDCDLTAIGIDDNEIDRIMAAKGHEGARVEGYTVELA